MKVERDILASLVCLVQEVDIQQVVEKLYHMEAYVPDIFQVNVPLFLFPRVHCQFGVAGNDVQRSPDIVRQGKDDVLAHIEQCRILFYDFFQPLFCPCFLPYVPHDNPIGDDKQDDGTRNQSGHCL